jgi:hypothetical protein
MKHTSARRTRSVRRTAARLAVIPIMQTMKMMIPVRPIIPYDSRYGMKSNELSEMMQYAYFSAFFMQQNRKMSPQSTQCRANPQWKGRSEGRPDIR